MERSVKSIEVDCPVSTVYNQWTQFEEFPQFMENVKQVVQLDDKRLHWVAEIGGKTKEWDARITEQIPDKRIAWTSEGGEFTAGAVTFEPLGPNRTRVTVELSYDPKGVVENWASSRVASRKTSSGSKNSSKAGSGKPAPGAEPFASTPSPSYTSFAGRSSARLLIFHGLPANGRAAMQRTSRVAAVMCGSCESRSSSSFRPRRRVPNGGFQWPKSRGKLAKASASLASPLSEALKRMSGANTGRLLVMDDGRMLGMLTQTGLLRFLEIKRALGEPAEETSLRRRGGHEARSS